MERSMLVANQLHRLSAEFMDALLLVDESSRMERMRVLQAELEDLRAWIAELRESRELDEGQDDAYDERR